MRSNDSAYDGRFWVGVISTGIYCLPSCPAKTPLVKNVVFFGTREEAVEAGLRACKRCRPDEYPHIRPEWWDDVLDLIQNELAAKLSEEHLSRAAQVDISTIRRYFKQHLKTTPVAFHRKLRLEHARRLIQSGADYLTAAFECGFESSSGFRDAFVREFGETPGSVHEKAE